MTTSKLPEWPEEPEWLSAQRRWRFGIHTTPGAGEAQQWYHHALSLAALARMEALVEVVREHHWAIVKDATTDTPAQAHERLDKLLAACERKEAGR